MDYKKIANNFVNAQYSYDQSAIVQAKVCKKLMRLVNECLSDIKKSSPRSVLEIGCGTGILTKIYSNQWQLDELFLNDLYDPKLPIPANFLLGDVCKLELPKVEMILSSSALQWIVGLACLFDKVYQALDDGGVFAFSSFGVDNCHELKSLIGVGLNYHDVDALVSMLESVGFEILIKQSEYHTLYFDNPKDILKHLKDTGAILGGYAWNKASWREFCVQYQQKFAVCQEGLWRYQLSYEPIYIVAKKNIKNNRFKMTKPHS